jgi:hypothetical protein
MSLRAAKTADYFNRYFGQINEHLYKRRAEFISELMQKWVGGPAATNICQGYDGARHSTGIVR